MKLNKISLQNLSQAEMAKKEQNLLRGGRKLCPCAGSCACTGYATSSSGYYEGSNMMGLDFKEVGVLGDNNRDSYNSGYSY